MYFCSQQVMSICVPSIDQHVMNNDAINTQTQAFVRTHVFISAGYIPSNGISGLNYLCSVNIMKSSKYFHQVF